MQELDPNSVIHDAPAAVDDLRPEPNVPSADVLLHGSTARVLSDDIKKRSLSEDEINWLRRAVVEGGSAQRVPREYVPSARVAKVLEPGLADEVHVAPSIDEIQVELGRIIKGLVYEWAVRKIKGDNPPPVIDGTTFDEQFQEELFSRIRLRIGNGSRFFNLLYMDIKEAMRTGATIDGAWGRLEWQGRKLQLAVDPNYRRTVRDKLGDLFPT